MGFREVNVEEVVINPFAKIGKEWMLITAGNQEKFNTMTASWGGMGVIWQKNAITTYIRPQRYTKEFIDANDLFTVSFYNEEHRSALNICGTLSGRHEDKVKKAGLTPYFTEGTVAFEQAEVIMVCKKMYHAQMPPENFVSGETVAKFYPEKDFHTMYVSEIVKMLVRE